MNANVAEFNAVPSPSLRIAIWIDQRNLLSDLTLLRQLGVALSAEGTRVYILGDDVISPALIPYFAGYWAVQSGSWKKWVKSGRVGNEKFIASELRRHKIDVLLLMGWSQAQASVLSHIPEVTIIRWQLDRTGSSEVGEDSHSIFASQEIRLACGAPEHSTVIAPGILINEGNPTTRRHAGEGITAFACLDPIDNPSEYERFLKAFAAARRSTDHILLLLDAGPAKDTVWRTARDLKLLNRVSFIPAVGAISPAIQVVDVVINISPQSRLWLVGIEAMAAGRAVVCRGSSLTSIFTADTCRLVTSSDDWAQCLEDLAMQPTRTRILCENAHLCVKRQHSMADFVTRFTNRLIDLKRGSIPLKKASATQ